MVHIVACATGILGIRHVLIGKDAEPVINAIVDGGVLAGHVATTAAGTGLVAAAFPVSVPYFLYTGKKTEVPAEKHD